MNELYLVNINVGNQSYELTPVPGDLIKHYLGGRGIATAISAERIPNDCKPFDATNVLTICTGLLTGTGLPTAARTHFCALSPLTGLLGSSNAGGFFGVYLRKSQIMGLVIEGRSSEPVYLHIQGQNISFRSSTDMLATDTEQCEEILSARYPGSRILCIGPAGENRVAMASIVHNAHSSAGRTGMGAVMGSKNIKAIVVEDNGRSEKAVTNMKALKASYLKPLRANEMFAIVSRYGQSGYIKWCNTMRMLSTRNYQQNEFSGADAICGSELGERVKQHKACASCPIRCKAETVSQGAHLGKSGPRPEFESIAALGAKCGQDDPDNVLSLSYICGRLGLDTISAGSVIAFAMEMYQKGLLSLKDTNGVELTWGNYAAQEKLLTDIAFRKGLGDILADGVRAAAEKIGKGSEKYAMHVKGLELCAYDPRGSQATALGYAVSGRGGDFASVFATAEYRWTEEQGKRTFGSRDSVNRFSPISKGQLVRRSSLSAAVVDALGICKVAALGIPAAFDLVSESKLVRGYVGTNIQPEDLFVIGERIINLERVFNIRMGGSLGVEDTLPARFLNETLEAADVGGGGIDLDRMLEEYYQVMSWDESGYPLHDKLVELELRHLYLDRDQ